MSEQGVSNIVIDVQLDIVAKTLPKVATVLRVRLAELQARLHESEAARGCQDCAYEVGVPVPGPTGLCPKHADEQIDGRHAERRRRVEAEAQNVALRAALEGLVVREGESIASGAAVVHETHTRECLAGRYWESGLCEKYCRPVTAALSSSGGDIPLCACGHIAGLHWSQDAFGVNKSGCMECACTGYQSDVDILALLRDAGDALERTRMHLETTEADAARQAISLPNVSQALEEVRTLLLRIKKVTGHSTSGKEE